MLKQFATSALLVLASSVAMADDAPHFYGGADLSTTKFREDSNQESGYGIFAGYQFNQTFGVELGYRSLADVSERIEDPYYPHSYRVKLQQFGISATGAIGLTDKLSLFGRLGYNRITYRIENNFNYGFREHKEKGLFGVGLKYEFTPTIAGRVELQKATKNLSTLSAGVSFRF
jgi:OmpA-OmpF porin, OOP family